MSALRIQLIGSHRTVVGTGCLLTLQEYSVKQVAKSNHELPALELLIEMELEDGSQDSLLRALDYQRECCKREQAWLDEYMDIIENGSPFWARVMMYRHTRCLEEVRLLEVSRCLARNQCRNLTP